MAPILARMIFLARDKQYEKEKPYSPRYSPLDKNVTENIERETIKEITMLDIRDFPRQLAFTRADLQATTYKVSWSSFGDVDISSQAERDTL